MNTYLDINMHAYTHACMATHIHKHKYMHTYLIYAYIQTYLHAYNIYKYVCLHTYICMHKDS